MKKVILACLLSLLFYGNPAWSVVVNTMQLNVEPEQKVFQIVLQANPSTGYQWRIKGYDRSILNLLKTRYVHPDHRLIGASGQMIYVFEFVDGVDLPASTVVTFDYSRGWEKETAIHEVVTVNFRMSQ